MSTQVEVRTRTSVRREEFFITESFNVIKAYPGDTVRRTLSVDMPTRTRVFIDIRGLPSQVASVCIEPREAYVPFKSLILLKIHRHALPGIYFFELILSTSSRETHSTKPFVLLILPREKTSFYLDRLRIVEIGKELYSSLGPSLSIYWFILNLAFHGISEVELRTIHWFHRNVASVKSKNSTMKILERLMIHNIVEKVKPGVYRCLYNSPLTAMYFIDRKRVRTRSQVLSTSSMGIEHIRIVETPFVVTRVIDTARKLIESGKLWKAVDFLAHTVLPVRKTGVLLAWLGEYFIYYERKDSKTHILRSRILSEVFKSLKISEGDLTLHRQHEASDLIKRMFGCHDNARRVHYLLKQLNWFQQIPPERYFYRIEYGVKPLLIVYKLNSSELAEILFKTPLTYIPPRMPNVGPLIPFEHIKAENEERYFYRFKKMVK